MLTIGFLFFALGTWWMTSLTRDWDFWELLWPQIFRGVGLMLAMVPINNVALGTLAPERVKNASGLYNLMRNLGGAVGLAAIYTFLNDRTDLHVARLHENFTFAHRPAMEALTNMAARFQSYGADAQAMALEADDTGRASPGCRDGLRRRVLRADAAVRGARGAGGAGEEAGRARRRGREH